LLTTLYRDKNQTDFLPHQVEITERHVFYPYTYQDAHTCFKATDSKSSRAGKNVMETTVSVHLNTKMTKSLTSFKTLPGSYCNDLFHKYCIFCDEVYTASSTKAGPKGYSDEEIKIPGKNGYLVLP
jgi:hypothetical protein